MCLWGCCSADVLGNGADDESYEPWWYSQFYWWRQWQQTVLILHGADGNIQPKLIEEQLLETMSKSQHSAFGGIKLIIGDDRIIPQTHINCHLLTLQSQEDISTMQGQSFLSARVCYMCQSWGVIAHHRERNSYCEDVVWSWSRCTRGNGQEHATRTSCPCKINITFWEY